MSDAWLMRLARRAGLETCWRDAGGAMRAAPLPVLRAVLAALGLAATSEAECRDSEAALEREAAHGEAPLIVVPAGEEMRLPGGSGRWRVWLEGGGTIEGTATEGGVCVGMQVLPPGYHAAEKQGFSGTLAVVPERAFALADAGSGRRLAGLAVQLYGLRRAHDGGIGDFRALERLAERAATHGVDALAISPVHALPVAEPARFSPYSPSSRIALNGAYAPCDPGPAGERLEDRALIDWSAAIALRLDAQRRAFAAEAASPRFAEFCRDAGPELDRYALFEAIATWEVAKGRGGDWRRWPAELRDPEGAAVREFAARRAEDVRFRLYLQYRAAVGLAAAANAARRGGMAIGLITDLAVGADPGGADAWGRRCEMLNGVSIGAPPDLFNREGQNWGLSGFSPLGLHRGGFGGFLAMLRSALRYAGGVRIDHAMGLKRLWVIPDGASAAEGVYLNYPCPELLGLIALESQRHRSVILAEDLGTVPVGFSERLARLGVAGLNVLWFERTAEEFRPPSRWRTDAAAMTSTHDLPTVAGWWRGRDIAWRARLGRSGQTMEERRRDRSLLWGALVSAGCASGSEPDAEGYRHVADAAAAYLGRTASHLALLPLEDALALTEQPNMPATTDEHPNWRRRLPEPVETMLERPDVAARLAALSAGRARP